MCQSLGEFGASRTQTISVAPESSDTVGCNLQRAPHQGESNAIIVMNQPAFCLCCIAGHMVWGGSMKSLLSAQSVLLCTQDWMTAASGHFQAEPRVCWLGVQRDWTGEDDKWASLSPLVPRKSQSSLELCSQCISRLWVCQWAGLSWSWYLHLTLRLPLS